jgi:hypothetical protein
MKNLYILALIIFASLTTVSCEEDLQTLDVNDPSNSVIGFVAIDPVNLSVLEGTGSGTVDAEVGVSTVSNVDRTFNVTVNTAESTATADIYSVPSTVTIPAGSYIGTLTITGNETPNLTPTAANIVVEITSEDAFVTTPLTVRVFKVCPIPADYLVGDYDLIQIQQAGFGISLGLFRGPDSTPTTADRRVTLEVGSDQTLRTFLAIPRSGGAAQARTFTLSLVCGKINLTGIVGDPINGGLNYGPGATATDYSLNDDSSILINYTGNVNGAFGGTPAQGQFVLQKR